MFIELEVIFNNIGSFKEVNYSFSPEGEELISSDVNVISRIENRAGIVTFKGKANFVLKALCDRCAEEFTRDMTVDFEHVLVTELQSDDNDDFILVENMKLDVDSLIREDIILSLPSQLLCKEDCKGLCHICGANLNEKQCGCKKPVDARLAVLMQLLDDDN
ncbi:MAG: DUF177 domain-containing protein [Ruminococcaceae bacterium]|jgi:uncharacterized protein|nr:DUF177 domain-containing protein [Oscillospiraceae bacterium]